MILGMPTLIETKSLDDCAALCAELKLNFIELNMNLPQYQLGSLDISYYKEISEKYGIFYTVHLDENLNISDFNPYVAEAYRRTVFETICFAKKMGIKILNMHLSRGVHFTLPHEKFFLFSEYKDIYRQSICDFKAECEKAIGDSDITICIENSNGFLDFQKDALGILLDSDVFALTFDIGHNFTCGNADEKYICEHKNKLKHMHIHDAAEKKDHLALGFGELDVGKYFSLADECNCRVVLETKTIDGLRDSVNWVRQRGV